VIVGDLVEWLGQALNAAAEQSRPLRAASRRQTITEALTNGALLGDLADHIGVQWLRSRRLATSPVIRFYGECRCDRRFFAEVDEEDFVLAEERVIALVWDAIKKARDATCHCIVKGSVPQ
jgi:hypothetical protein